MKPTLAVLTASLCILALTAAAQQQEVERGQRLASFEMTWTQRSVQTITSRAQAAAEVVTGRHLERRGSIISAKSPKEILHRTRLRLPDAPALEVVYLPEYDELRIADKELAASTSPRSEISQEEAIDVAKRTFEALAQRKLVDPRHFNWDKADIASTWVASKPGAGELEEPTGAGRWLQRSTTTADLQSRFEREMVPVKAKPKVAWSRVMYVMPENKRTALVPPLYVISYSLEFPGYEGTTVVSRRKTVGLSLVDSKVAPIDLTPPVRMPVTEKIRKSVKP